MRLLFAALVLFGSLGCGGSSEPVVPENPTPPPANGPSSEGLPAAGGQQ